MKRLWLAVSAIALGLSAGAVTYDGKVLDGEWLINGSEDVIVNGTVSGTGDIRFQQTAGILKLYCVNTAVGNIYLDWGKAEIYDPKALGSGTLYVNDEVKSDVDKRVYLKNDMTVGNAVFLGSESKANWASRLVVSDGKTANLTGPLSVSSSKGLVGTGGRFVLAGGVTGSKFIATGYDNATVEIAEKPMTLTGAFFVGGPGWNVENNKVVLSVAGNTTTGLYGFDNCTLKLGVDNPFAAPVPFAPQTGKKFSIDLNGHNLDLGSCANEGAGYGDTSACTILNSATTGEIPTVSVAQVNDNFGGNEVGAVLGTDEFHEEGVWTPDASDVRHQRRHLACRGG